MARSRGRIRTWLRLRTVLRLAVFAIAAAALVGFGSIAWVRHQASDAEYSLDNVPAAEVALIPGAQVYGNGQPSPYLAARLELGRRLLEAGKVRALLLTGDNGTSTYDEPSAMRGYLVRKGVPANKIALDYAGFSTYESCERAHRIFGVRQAIVVTQDFSLPRTVALCRNAGIETTGIGDDTQPHNFTYEKCWLRDQLAATKAVFDMVVHPDPKFLGRQETTVRDAINASPSPTE
ncbi:MULTISPECIES: vancomycin high temperature exclusion protein [unclassified Nocardia]|uniref:SanA/YdcF family protein n=1 Tax=unclassified Nocardia TaxID=2637762 RepID=UPI001CE3F2D5|nr:MULTISPECIES: ElyC/SanA/YdcF family protein [unclassified Nocardia]